MRIIGIRQAGLCGGVALGIAQAGCNSFDEPAGPESEQPRLVIPLDERAAVTAPLAPRTISGGTLSVLADSSAAIVSDPDRDQVSIVDLVTLGLRHTVKLEPGDEPGRSVEDGNKRIHVVLRRSGGIATIDPASGTVVDRRAVCKAPRGIAFEPITKQLHVACSEGKLVSLPAEGGAAVRSLSLEPDLRDVLVRGSELWVTRLKSADVLRISSAGVLDQRISMPLSQGQLSQPGPASDGFPSSVARSVTLQSGVAWRAVPNAAGGAVIVHQQTVVDDIDITEPSVQGSAYGGGGFDCSGIVKNAITSVAADGTVKSAPFSGAPLPVDVAVSPNQTWVAVAHAGSSDVLAPRPFLVFPDTGGGSSGGGVPSIGFAGSSLSIMALANISANSGGGCNFSEGGFSNEPVTAVAFAPDGRLLAQTREPPQLLVFTESNWGTATTLSLSGESRLDTGHELFHRDAGGGIACASCHPEGGEDGRTWHFTDTGARRTQALHVGLRDTAPFHWNGDLENVGELMSEVFVGRMGGVRQTAPRLNALSEWLFSIEPPPAIRDAGDAAAIRGQELFHSASVGCATCHAGDKLTSKESVAIDTVTAKKLQVPSLVAVGYRSPFMHDGCAATLTARFDPACGGDAHGNTSTLDEAQLADLVAYPESL